MKAFSRRCVFLTGAPENSTLDWSNAGCLLSGYDDPVRRFVEGGNKLPASFDSSMLSSKLAKWRALPLNDLKATVPFTAKSGNGGRTTSSKKTYGQLELVDEDFVDNSIALLETLDSSQIIPTLPAATETTDVDISFTTHSTDISFDTTNIDSTICPSQPQHTNSVTLSGLVTDLKHLPTSQTLTTLYPQTQTVNLIAGIVTVSPPQKIHSRKPHGKDRDLISLIIGDETRAGFKINFWLAGAPEISNKHGRDGADADVALRTTLLRLRAGDVLMLSNVALSSWNGSVYGQNLSRRFARNSTEIVVLPGGSTHLGMTAPLATKLRRVREWVSDFVGIIDRGKRDEASTGEGQGITTTKRKRQEELPPDTQD